MNKSVNNTEKGLLSLNKVIGALSLTVLTRPVSKICWWIYKYK